MNVQSTHNQGHPVATSLKPAIESMTPGKHRPVSSSVAGAQTGGPLYFDPTKVEADRPAFSAREAAAQLEGKRPQASLTANEITKIAQEIRSSLTDDRSVRSSATPLVTDAERSAPEQAARTRMTDELVERLMQKIDLNQDSVISASEAPFSDAAFSSIDADGDGSITGNELFETLHEQFQKASASDPTLDAEQFALSFLFGATSLPDIKSSSTQPLSTAPEDQRTPVTSAAGEVRLHGAAEDGNVPASRAEAAANEEADELSSSQRLRLQEIARQIAERLDEAGHKDQPPSNIQDIVSELGLKGSSAGFVMRLMHARFPQGLGMSLFA